VLAGSITAFLIALLAGAAWGALALARRIFAPRVRRYRCTLAVVVPEPEAAPAYRCRPSRAREPERRRSAQPQALPGKLQATR